ncbi:hypothetical protein V8G54_018837 [Vigna mungo]|uniref:Amino acid transporter transmembrane domain-containing protein n=1 Tax=Vigna mungo TaxID=3915 RepID=A0AAQ3RV36_VIGMU
MNHSEENNDVDVAAAAAARQKKIDDLASSDCFTKCKMVVFNFPQSHSHGWCRCSHPSLCHVKYGLGSWSYRAFVVMDYHPLYAVANGGDARNAKGVEPDANYGIRATNSTDAVFNFLSALGDVAFAYAGHNVVFAMPVFDMIETYMVTKLNFPPSAVLRVTTRTVYVALTTVVAICIPFFGSLLGFLGGFASAPTSFFLPCVIWLKLIKPKRYGLSWTINWICIVLGVLLMILSPIAAMRNIVMSAKDYKFFS